VPKLALKPAASPLQRSRRPPNTTTPTPVTSRPDTAAIEPQKEAYPMTKQLPADDPAVMLRDYKSPPGMLTRDATEIKLGEFRARLARRGLSAAEIEAAVAQKFFPKQSATADKRADGRFR
jgi:hypothetical protein